MAQIFGFDCYSPRESASRVEEIGVAKLKLPWLSQFALGVLAVFIAPVAAPLFVGYLVGIDLMFSGLALLAFAASRRREAWT